MRIAALALAAGLLLGVAACGGGGNGNAQPAGSIKVTMTEFKFDPNSITHASGNKYGSGDDRGGDDGGRSHLSGLTAIEINTSTPCGPAPP